jgi:hypothetical protein
VNYLSESVRGGFTESVTLLQDGDDDLVIWQVDGKIVEDIAVAEVQTQIDDPVTGLDAIYANANAAAAAAASAAATATTAQTSANGKNKVTYSTSGPGSTANTAGDIWFQKNGATQTIIGQWEGLGGTSWSAKTIDNAVIANLDAGKLTAGSAFINGLTVKTNFNLGDASTNGVIQSYNFAGSPVGVYLDKNGLVAKGGSISGATLTGIDVTGSSTITGATGGTAASGNRVEMSGAVSGGRLSFYSGASTMYIDGVSLGAGVLYFNANKSVFSADVEINDDLDVHGALNADSGVGIFGGLTVYSGGAQISGAVELNVLDGTGGSSFVMTGNDGVLSRGAPSSLRYKENVKSLDARVSDALLKVDTITWQYKDRDFHGDRTYAGVPAEQLHDLGLGLFVDYDDEGRPDQVRYWELTAPLIALCQSQQAQIDALSARLDALEAAT